MTLSRICLGLLALAAAGAQGCVSVRSSHGYVLERGETELTARPGIDTKESVLAKYGEPSMIGAFNENSWYYMASTEQSRAFFRPETTSRSIVAFRFDEEGFVKNVETYSLEDGMEINLVSRETPTRGKELTFWEQLLGNVGQLPALTDQQQQVPGR
ncbi:outer membrane protein assembly factor BamE [Amphiplicatus metriothermophilus]|uniref:Beta-barrel assembly machine subunit BamE n=1 Tax=Amphiplicatus metriothermophilus TaxID=1519374 RepID=A0A239PNY0_9PROT|nr:outer membrane protein assembly factor BamE [Amphiplicatus metriothermophilus]MBB5518836.1 outer membrane protein assembly factor BamE (lipoprotein component of BamABCDE complex) [Amphiplicatus metriothermophilus]SNT72011.1 Beta-barrel assembly machine subunit BamE [Amphiplicatus metriothermophilus]